MTKIRMLLLLLIVFITSCDMKERPIDVITNLQGVSEIQILTLDKDGNLKVNVALSSQDVIDYFIKTFEIAKNLDGTKIEVDDSLFIKDGEIRFLFENGQQPFVVEYDLDKGYKVEIGAVEYYEQFTY